MRTFYEQPTTQFPISDFLRHTAASLLLAAGVSMKEIQKWLGHSDFGTTANIYGHLDVNSKIRSADAMISTGMKLVVQT